jgi:uncharacterized membrane protein
MTLASRIGWGLAAFLSIGVALVSVRYLIPDAPGLSPNVMENPMVRFGALTVHAGFALTALMIGPFQFLASIRRRWPSTHRRLGTLYVLCCMGGGLSGLVLASSTTAGPIGVAGFGGLAIAWLFTTGQAWRHVRARRFADHERWMIRSFALTFAAVTLRLYLPIAPILGYDFMPAYTAISWLCWVPNLIVAELVFVPRASLRTSPQP